MNEKERIRTSKRLALHLRHDPAAIGLTLESGGWVPVDALLRALAITREQLDEVVETNTKRRSAPVDLALPDTAPPAVSTTARWRRSSTRSCVRGLRPMQRHAVHLSATTDTARTVGARRGKPVILRIDAAAMTAAGHTFQVSANGVWLTASVPPQYLHHLP